MPGQLGRNQMIGVTSWKGTVTKENHLYKFFDRNPQKASEKMTILMSAMHLPTLNTYLSTEVPVKTFEDDTDIFWDIISSSRRNVALVEARRADGTVVTAGSANVGMGFEPFYLVFQTDWFAKGEVLWGPMNEEYPMINNNDVRIEGTNYVYKVEMFGANGASGCPAEYLLAGARFSVGYAPVEDNFSRKVGDVRFSTPVSMRSDFSRIRIQHKVGGKEIGKRLCASIPVTGMENGKMVTKVVDRWMYYVTWKIEEQFEEYKNNALYRGVSTRFENGEYSNFGLSGLANKQGSGLRELMKYGRQQYYSKFSIELLEQLLTEISAGKLDFKQRKFVVRTGERGLTQASKAMKEQASGWLPLLGSRDGNPAYILSGPETNYTNGNARTLVTEQYTRWIGPNGLDVTFMVDSSYDDEVTNKIYHPKGGPAESYRYDIFYAGDEEEPNVQKCVVSSEPDRRGYQWGPFFNPFTNESNNGFASFDEDAAVVHYKSTLGILMRDPSRCISLIPNILKA